jgi:hypothetical protein
LNTGNDAYRRFSTNLVATDGQLVNVQHIVYARDLDGDGRKELLVGRWKME